jgi:hypothetical protein
MTKLAVILSTLVITACGGGSECPDTITRQRVTDATGTYIQVCSSFQCPGFTREVFCRKEY